MIGFTITPRYFVITEHLSLSFKMPVLKVMVNGFSVAGDLCFHISLHQVRRSTVLEALRLQFQVKALLSPHLAHQVLWNRLVNTKGGLGRNTRWPV